MTTMKQKTNYSSKARILGCLTKELYIAYLDARKGKRKTFDEYKFEMHALLNIVNLANTIANRTYRPSRGTAHVIYNPVIREIFAACFRDRVVHHWIYNMVYDWWDKHFIYDSYSCRVGKGTLFGIKRLKHHIESVAENGLHEAWVIKLDIQGYFMSMRRDLLYERAVWGLNQQFKDRKNWRYYTLKFLWAQIIFDDPCRGVRRKGWPNDWKDVPDTKSLFKQKPGIGIVIGNLTSQLLSNILLDLLDRFVTEELGYKHYGRYVDDFYIVVPKEDLVKAKADIKRIEAFLKRLGLTLHPKKRMIQPAKRGVPFLGAVVYPNRILPGARIKKNAFLAFDEVVSGKRSADTVISYMGHMKHYKSDKALSELFDKVGWIYNFEKSNI